MSVNYGLNHVPSHHVIKIDHDLNVNVLLVSPKKYFFNLLIFLMHNTRFKQIQTTVLPIKAHGFELIT